MFKPHILKHHIPELPKHGPTDKNASAGVNTSRTPACVHTTWGWLAGGLLLTISVSSSLPGRRPPALLRESSRISRSNVVRVAVCCLLPSGLSSEMNASSFRSALRRTDHLIKSCSSAQMGSIPPEKTTQETASGIAPPSRQPRQEPRPKEEAADRAATELLAVRCAAPRPSRVQAARADDELPGIRGPLGRPAMPRSQVAVMLFFSKSAPTRRKGPPAGSR